MKTYLYERKPIETDDEFDAMDCYETRYASIPENICLGSDGNPKRSILINGVRYYKH